MFNISCLCTWWPHNIWISEKLKSDYLKNKKSFCVLKALSFRHTKQTSKNVADTTFKDCVRYFSFFFNKWQPLNNYKKCFSILCIRVSTPSSKTPPPLSCKAPPLNLKTVQASPLFRQSPSLYWFFVNSSPPPPKSWIFQLTPQTLKFFIVNLILSFKNN